MRPSRLGRTGSLPAHQAGPTGCRHSALHSLERQVDRVNPLLSKMTSAGDPDKQNLLSLPKDLLDGIGAELDDKDLCKFELASKRLYSLISNPPRPGERKLDLCRFLSPKESRLLFQLASVMVQSSTGV